MAGAHQLVRQVVHLLQDQQQLHRPAQQHQGEVDLLGRPGVAAVADLRLVLCQEQGLVREWA